MFNISGCVTEPNLSIQNHSFFFKQQARNQIRGHLTSQKSHANFLQHNIHTVDDVVLDTKCLTKNDFDHMYNGLHVA